MSFSSKVREEIINIKNIKKIEKVCRLCGIIRFAGIINFFGRGEIGLNIPTENPAIARKIFSIYKDVYGEKLDIFLKKNSLQSKKSSYILSIRNSETLKEILVELGIIEYNDGNVRILNDIPSFISKSIENSKSYITGAYIVSGSMSDPEKFYHVEFNSQSEQIANEFSKLLKKFSIKSNISERKDSYICYVKEADSISNLLNILGAHQAMFEFEDIRIKKQMRNDINRIVNCETSNLDRVVKASVRQLESIKYIEKNKGLDILEESLREIAKIRLENPEMSLREIGGILKNPITKSGVNHRLMKIEKIAEKLKEEKNANTKNNHPK